MGYSRLRKSFQNLFIRRGYQYDNVFDWTIKRFLELEHQKNQPSEELQLVGDNKSRC